MTFDNLTDEQVEWLEKKIEEAYEEGVYDAQHDCIGEGFSESLAKNLTCHMLAMRFMKSSDYNYKYEG